MKNYLLLPNYFKAIGAALLVVFIILFIAWAEFDFQFSFLAIGKSEPADSFNMLFEDRNLTNEFICVGLLAGLIFISFSKEKKEDERIQLIRLKSLQVSHYLNYLLFAIALFLFNGISFIGLAFYLPYIFLITFIVVYYCKLYLLPKFAHYEE